VGRCACAWRGVGVYMCVHGVGVHGCLCGARVHVCVFLQGVFKALVLPGEGGQGKKKSNYRS